MAREGGGGSGRLGAGSGRGAGRQRLDGRQRGGHQRRGRDTAADGEADSGRCARAGRQRRKRGRHRRRQEEEAAGEAAALGEPTARPENRRRVATCRRRERYGGWQRKERRENAADWLKEDDWAVVVRVLRLQRVERRRWGEGRRSSGGEVGGDGKTRVALPGASVNVLHDTSAQR